MKRLSSMRESHGTYTDEQALSVMIDAGLTKSQYTMMQQRGKKVGCSLLPSYKRVSKAKTACLPPQNAIAVEPDQARVKMQQLLDHTTARLLQLQAEVLSSVTTDFPAQLTLHCKWGMDGSSAHSQYKQTGVPQDDQMFIVSLVPLQLETHSGAIVWRNATPSSTRFCRPLSLQFAKETKALTEDELQRTRAEVADLQPLVTDAAIVTHMMTMTMVDGKTVNVATGTASTQRCSMCGLTSKSFNDLEAVAARPVTNVEYGLSSLHCWIRSFECLLHISYRLPLTLDARGHVPTDQKPLFEEQKNEVKSAFRRRMGLRVDEPRAGGSGTSNDGNTARRAFSSAADFAACTGLEQQLIEDIHVVLQAVSCFYPVNAEALSAFCKRAAERYVSLYGWYPMSTTLHRLLAHSAAVIDNFDLPIGMMSEEAAESLNKCICEFRLKHTRKDSRLHTMSDMFGYLLVASDPVLSSVGQQERRRKYARRQGTLLPETLRLLADPALPAVGMVEGCDCPVENGDSSESSSSSESDE